MKPQWYVSGTSYWNVITASQEDVSTTFHQYVSTMSQLSLKWNTQRRLLGTYPRYPISTPLLCLLYVPNEIPNNVATTPPHVAVTLLRRLFSRSLLHFQVTLPWAQSGVGFHATFKYQIKHQEGNKKSSLDHKLAELLLQKRLHTSTIFLEFIA